MGKNNRVRQAAPPDDVHVAVRALGVARRDRGRGVPVSEWTGPLSTMSGTLIDRAVDMMTGALLGHLFAGGWTPIDVFELSRRRVDAIATAYLMDAVAAATAAHPDHVVDYGRGVRSQATLCRIWLDNPYISAKSMLVNAVAQANRCRAVMDSRFGLVTVIGDEGDLRAVELLATSLLVQCARAMLSTGSQLTRSGISRTRSYRQAFVVSYASRIGERLRAANEAGVADADASRLLPVLSARSKAVDDLMEQKFPRLVTKRVSISNEAGWGAGRAAADAASLGVHATLDNRDDQPRGA